MTIYEELKEIEKKLNYKFEIPKWSDSMFQERLIRFGREFNFYNLESPFDRDTETLIRESLIEDIIKTYKHIAFKV